VVSFGVRKPKTANPIIPNPNPMLIALDDLFVPRDVMPLATLSDPIIIRVISIKKRRV
jgi:hypothetical protein